MAESGKMPVKSAAHQALPLLSSMLRHRVQLTLTMSCLCGLHKGKVTTRCGMDKSARAMCHTGLEESLQPSDRSLSEKVTYWTIDEWFWPITSSVLHVFPPLCFHLYDFPLLNDREEEIARRERGVPRQLRGWIETCTLGSKMHAKDTYAECNHQQHVNKTPAAFLATPVTGKTTQPFL